MAEKHAGQPDITITIPLELVSEYLGILALDTLHDAKGYGYLVGHTLAQLTDLFAEALIICNDIPAHNHAATRNFVFEKVLDYFKVLWADNPNALGLNSGLDSDSSLGLNSNSSSDIEMLRATVKLPIRRVAERDNEDTFITLGKNKLGIEAQNYQDQKEKLHACHCHAMTFISPQGVEKPSDYFNQALGLVDIIHKKIDRQTRSVLDMKSSAGLIRTITDPLGYITGLPTFADPGYNMPGMSAIRQYAKIAFNGDTDPFNGSVTGSYGRSYEGPSRFHYRIQLETPLSQTPLVLLDVNYFYGAGFDGLDRNNICISILDEPFIGSLPRSMMMAETLSMYLQPAPRQIKETASGALGIVEHLIWNYYDRFSPSYAYSDAIRAAFNETHQTQSIRATRLQELGVSSKRMAKNIKRWCHSDNTIFRISYVLGTLRNMNVFGINCLNDAQPFTPRTMITEILPMLMLEYITADRKPMETLAFCYHQYKLLQHYIGNPSLYYYQADLDKLLQEQWLPKRKGKLVTQIISRTGQWRKEQAERILNYSDTITSYIEQVISKCTQHLGVLLDLDHRTDTDANQLDEERIDAVLHSLPVFNPPILLEQTLTDHLHFYEPEMYLRTESIVRTGLLLSTLLDTMLWKKPLIKLDLNLDLDLTNTIDPVQTEYRQDHYKYDALRMMLGKFSGDFGQIVWSICHGHIFSTEDNNASAMALLLHRVPKDCIQRSHPNPVRWGNIHGLGDGSCVDIILNSTLDARGA